MQNKKELPYFGQFFFEDCSAAKQFSQFSNIQNTLIYYVNAASSCSAGPKVKN